MREDRASVGEVVQAVESDVALVITVLRIANRARSPKQGKVAAIPEAVEILTPDGVEALAARTATFDFFERTPGWDAAAGTLPPARRGHAGAPPTGSPASSTTRDRDELLSRPCCTTSASSCSPTPTPATPRRSTATRARPRSASMRERRELGVDHALVGGVLARRWGLPNRLATAIERHHADDAEGEAALVRLADMLAHYGHGQPVDPQGNVQAARACGLTTEQLCARVMYELPQGSGNVKRNVDPCPLSTREVEVLKRLAEGKVYKQIAHELELSTSTVRTHLHNTYAKLGAVDRAQAVLIATERGWI